MKQTLIIGSTVVDVIIGIPKLPIKSQDVNITSQTQSLGGCAYNVSNMLYLEKIPYTLCSPVGSGLYGEFVERELQKKGVVPFVRLDDIANGCCYCLVEDDGERTFLSHHGAEYIFNKAWMKNIDPSLVDSAYICGIEIEDPTGIEIVEYLEEHPEYSIFFAVGPRINYIEKSRLERLFNLKPIIHLNEIEALEYTKCNSVEKAAKHLNELTNNSLIITLGEKGALVFENGNTSIIKGYEATIVDTIGAGDCHVGSVISGLKQGFSLVKSVRRANAFSAAVVGVSGAILTEKEYKKVQHEK